jgi:hypothetical protein
VTASAPTILEEWYPGLLYTPGPTLGRFIRSIDPRILARCANQIGKTWAGAKRADMASLGELPGVAQVPNLGAVLIADLDNHYPEVCQKIAQVITMTALHPDCHFVEGKGFYCRGRRGIQYANGSRWIFRSGTGGRTVGKAGFTADWQWVDEIPDRAHYNEFTRGLRGGAPQWVTATPIGMPREWFRTKLEGDAETGAPPDERWEQFVAVLSTEECPWLQQWEVDARIASTDPFERAQRIYAEWEGPTEGRRFIGLTQDNIIDDAGFARAFRNSAPLVTIAADHGEGVGSEFWAMLVHDKHKIAVVDEYANTRPTKPSEDVPHILAMLMRQGANIAHVDRWVGDVNSSGKANAGSSVNRDFEAAFAAYLFPQQKGAVCPFEIGKPYKKPGSVEYGERLLNIALAANELLVHERCVKTLRALRGYVNPTKTADLKHPIDVLRYGAQPVLLDRKRPSYSKLYLRRR